LHLSLSLRLQASSSTLCEEMTMAKGASVSAAMADLDQEDAAPTTANMSSKKELLSTALKRTSEWFDFFLFCLI
jgi:hypothetical protein